MQLIPAIDIQLGKCVRLYQGGFEKVTVYHDDPIIMAQNFEKAGASWLHIVDLDGAKQAQSVHFEIISKIAQSSNLSIQVGGGIRASTDIRALLDKGVARIVIGSMAVTQPDQVKTWLREYGPDRLVLALDVNAKDVERPLVLTQGWQVKTTQTLWDILLCYEQTRIKHVLCTDICRDGVLNGPNFSLYQECLQRYPQLSWQASGGISTLSELNVLNKMAMQSAIIGKALYEGLFTLSEAIESVASC